MMTGVLRYEPIGNCSTNRARRGRIITPRGSVETPAFMPVGTYGAVKTLGSDDLEQLGFELILSNTYHLNLRPGSELIERIGGLHEFMSWKGLILTDSGGFQVMSLSESNRVTDEGVLFKSHLDGNEIFLTPERSVEIQAQLGVDISMCLDVCPPYPCSKDEAADAMAKTHAWSHRNLAAKRPDQNLFGIVQGGVHEDLRADSAEYMTKLPFEGFAIGGVSVGEPTELQYPVVAYAADLLPADKPRYLMGVGHPQDILHAVACGIDLFDCVLPTRMARHHSLYTMKGRVNAQGAEWAKHMGPYDEGSVFPANERYPAAYLRHLFKVGEPLAARLATLHNLAFYARLMKEIREAIETDSWDELTARYAEA